MNYKVAYFDTNLNMVVKCIMVNADDFDTYCADLSNGKLYTDFKTRETILTIYID